MMKRSALLAASVLLIVGVAYAAIDSADKRASAAFHHRRLTKRLLPLPANSIDSGDRAQLAGVYRHTFEAAASSTGSTTGRGSVFRLLRGRRR